MFLLIKKKKIAIIINASNYTSDFYFGHFIRAEDIPQSCVLIFSSQNQTLGFLMLFYISSITKIK